MSHESYFVRIDKEGAVHLRGGLVFFGGGGFLYQENNSGPSHTFTGCTMFSFAPKWWQLRRWWRLIQMIRSFVPTEPPPATAPEHLPPPSVPSSGKGR